MQSDKTYPVDPLVQLRGIGKYYLEADRQHVILDGVDASVERGELVVVLGRSGSGKSTLLNLISGIDLPSAGEVLIDGVALNRLSEQDRTLFRRRSIGFVFQFFNLLPTLTVLENLLLPLELNGWEREASRETALALLAEVGLADRADSFPDVLSGGEQQRVAVARALVHDPLLVLADEPTGNLDAETATQVLRLLDNLTRRKGKTLIMVTHSREAAELADTVYTIKSGRLVGGPAAVTP